MATRAHAVSEWEAAPFVLGLLGEGALPVCIGPVLVHGVEAAVSATQDVKRGELTPIPDLRLVSTEGQRSECGRWLAAWTPGGERRDLLLRDNRQKRWLALREAWVNSQAPDGGVVICLECVEPVDGPSP